MSAGTTTSDRLTGTSSTTSSRATALATVIDCARVSRRGRRALGYARRRSRTPRNAPRGSTGPRSRTNALAMGDWAMDRSEWPLWEIFIRSQHGLAHKHVGSLHAPDAEMAVKNARDVYTRRNEGVSIWVVRSADITATTPSAKEPLFDPASSKVYRHPTFFPMPDEVNHI